MAFEDKTLTCKDCGCEFVFSASEQEFYAEKGFVNEPGRCRSCRASRKAHSGEGRGPREMHSVICASCGVETQVPFKPRNEKPVYCQECFDKMRNQR